MITSEYIASSRASRPSAGQPADPLLNRHHQLYVIAAGNIVMAGFGVMWFGQTARFPLTPGSTILIVLSGGFLVAGLCAIVAGLAARVQGRQERDVVTEIQRHIDEATAGGVQTIGRVADVEATVTRIEAVVEERLKVLVDASAEQRQTLGELETRVQEGRKEGRKSAEVLDESFLSVVALVGEIPEQVADMLVNLRRVGQLTELLIGRTAAVEAAVSGLRKRLDGAEEALIMIGKPAPAAAHDNSNGKSGLDAEIIALARRISDKINYS